MTPGSLEIREELRRLMVECDADPRLQAEHARARREFFGGDDPMYAVGDAALEAAEIRFAEWFLLERENDNLGLQPIVHFRDLHKSADEASFELLSSSLTSMFIVESNKTERPRVRDLQGGERHDLEGVPDPVRPGDILVGRLFEAGTGAYIPSCVMAILAASPQVAVAFQKDLKGLGVDRRLTQAELEHLLFRRWGESAAERSQAQAETKPVEHVEAELEKLFEQAGIAGQYSTTDLSAAVKLLEEPGPALADFMDQMAFDTDIDLERLRGTMAELWAAHQKQKSSAGRDAADSLDSGAVAKDAQSKKPQSEDPKTEAGKKPEDASQAASDSAAKPAGFIPVDLPPPKAPKSADEDDSSPLGSRIAARLEEGLEGKEDIEALFASVEEMLGEKIDVDESEDIGTAEVGDVEALVREFVWEGGVGADDELLLKRFLETLETAPIPHSDLEGLRPDDYLRFLLERWLGSKPSERVQVVEQAFGLIEGLIEWAERTQGYVLAEHLVEVKRVFVDDLARLQSVSLQLSTSDQPDEGNGDLALMEIVTGYSGRVTVLIGDSKDEVEVKVADPILDLVREHDFLVGGIVREGGEGATLSGMVLMVPAALGHLLG